MADLPKTMLVAALSAYLGAPTLSPLLGDQKLSRRRHETPAPKRMLGLRG